MVNSLYCGFCLIYICIYLLPGTYEIGQIYKTKMRVKIITIMDG